MQIVHGGDVEVLGLPAGSPPPRASLAVALLDRPEMLVLDEPAVDVDPILRQELWDIFHRLTAAARRS